MSKKFIALLDESHQWPDFYDFKFIVKAEDKHLILEKLEGFKITENPSRNGNYVSLTARKLVKSTQEVIDVYEAISTIKGVISL